MTKHFGMKTPKSAAPAWFSSAEELGKPYSNPLSGMPLDRRERARAMGKEEPMEKELAAAKKQAEAEATKATETKAETANATKAAADADSATQAAEEPSAGTAVDSPTEPISESVSQGNTSDISRDNSAAEASNPTPKADVLSTSSYEKAQAAAEKRAAEKEEQSSSDEDEGMYLPLRDYCIRGRGADCSRCQLACPTGAISFDDQGYPLIDQELCSRCGICSGICDGFSSTRITLQDLNNRILRVASYADEVFLTCDENIFEEMNPADNVVVLPCLAAVPPELYTLLLAQGVKLTIACDFSYCANCLRAPGFGEPLYTAAINMAEEWTGLSVGIASAPPEQGDFLNEAINEGASRRDLFDNLIGGISNVTSGDYRRKTSQELQDFWATQERMRASVATQLDSSTSLNRYNKSLHKRMFPHRELLMEATNVAPHIAERIEVPISETDEALCCQELQCLDNCPTSARYADDFGNLCFDPSFCIGCGLCVAACPHEACSVTMKRLDDLGEPRTIGTRTAEDAQREAEHSDNPMRKTIADADNKGSTSA